MAEKASFGFCQDVVTAACCAVWQDEALKAEIKRCCAPRLIDEEDVRACVAADALGAALPSAGKHERHQAGPVGKRVWNGFKAAGKKAEAARLAVRTERRKAERGGAAYDGDDEATAIAKALAAPHELHLSARPTRERSLSPAVGDTRPRRPASMSPAELQASKRAKWAAEGISAGCRA